MSDWLRERLAVDNGLETDGKAGSMREQGRLLPALDRSDRKRRSCTARYCLAYAEIAAAGRCACVGFLIKQ